MRTTIIPAEGEGQRLERWLKKKYPSLPYGVAQKWLRTGQIRVDGKRVNGATILKQGQSLRLPPQLESMITSQQPPSVQASAKTLAYLKQQILYQDDRICVLNKPPGLAVQGGTKKKDHLDLYVNTLCPDNPEPLRLVHRIDIDTSGILVMAKSLTIARYLTDLFKKGLVTKRYLAVVVGKIKQDKGHISDPIGKLKGIAREKMSIFATDVRESSTTYRVLKTSTNGLTLLELSPQTGRTHQLRVHCAQSLKCPILGDGKYGGKHAQPFAQRVPLHLHAEYIEFPLLTNEIVRFHAPLPAYFQHTLKTYFE